jgi:hypothetical protein
MVPLFVRGPQARLSAARGAVLGLIKPDFIPERSSGQEPIAKLPVEPPSRRRSSRSDR